MASASSSSDAEEERRARRLNKQAASFLKRHTLHFGVFTVVLYATLIPLTIYIFPATTLLLTVIILITSLMGALSDLAGIVTDSSQDDNIEDLADDGKLNRT